MSLLSHLLAAPRAGLLAATLAFSFSATTPAVFAAVPTIIGIDIDYSYPWAMNSAGQFIGYGWDLQANESVPFFVDPTTACIAFRGSGQECLSRV